MSNISRTPSFVIDKALESVKMYAQKFVVTSKNLAALVTQLQELIRQFSNITTNRYFASYRCRYSGFTYPLGIQLSSNGIDVSSYFGDMS